MADFGQHADKRIMPRLPPGALTSRALLPLLPAQSSASLIFIPAAPTPERVDGAVSTGSWWIRVLRETLSCRRQNEFVDAKGMDVRPANMVAGKRRAHGLTS